MTALRCRTCNQPIPRTESAVRESSECHRCWVIRLALEDPEHEEDEEPTLLDELHAAWEMLVRAEDIFERPDQTIETVASWLSDLAHLREETKKRHA
jgi:phage FluMu protein Com